MSPVGLSLAALEIARAVESVEALVSRTNKKLTDAGQDELPRAYYLASEVDALRAEIAALKQPAKEPRKYHWGTSERVSPIATASAREAEPSSIGRPDAEVFVDMVAGALRDPRIGGRRLREALRLMVMVYRPSGTYGGAVKRPIAVLRAVQEWCNAIASMPIPPKDGDDRPVGPLVGNPNSGHSPDDLARAAALASGIESGEIIPIDRDAVAKFITASYETALREQQEKPR